MYICNNKVLCLATVCYAQPYLPQVCFLVWKFFPCRSKISPCTSTIKSLSELRLSDDNNGDNREVVLRRVALGDAVEKVGASA